MTHLRSPLGRPSESPVGLDRRRLLIGTATGLSVAVIGGTTLLLGTPAFAAPQVGRPAPDFSVTDSNGKIQSLSALRGKIVVLEWTNHDCPFVQKHYGATSMQTLQREVTGAGAVWLSVISSAPGQQGHVDGGAANALTQSRKAAPTAVLLDPQGIMGRAYNAQTTPHMYIINAEGTLLYMGGIDSIPSTKTEDLTKAQPYFKEAFLAVSAGKPVQNAATRPYGCNVKYVGT